jgi:S-adenosylmethionine-diacylglycerol 3-amino-3-carboxypropyl transferase
LASRHRIAGAHHYILCMTALASPAGRLQAFRRATHDRLFGAVHGSTLIYNTCWEDPRIDRRLLRLAPGSRVAMITSAGCNALEYLLDDPAEVHAVDVNPLQNALLELKRAFLASGDGAGLEAFFARGSDPDHEATYARVRPLLPAFARRIWDRRLDYFRPRTVRGSFYFRGGSGLAAWTFLRAVRMRPRLRGLVDALLEARSLQEQRATYDRLEGELWTPMVNGLVRQPTLMALLGVPRPQIQLILDSHPGGLAGFVRDRVRHVTTQVPMHDNYFWRVYVHGRYGDACRPEYLRPANLDTLGDRVWRLHTHTSTVARFLEGSSGTFSHFVLLDHQDWLAAHDPQALRHEWEWILARSHPGTRILLRSAGLDHDFIPPEIRRRLRWRPDLTEPLHPTDRVGTYGSTHLAEVP